MQNNYQFKLNSKNIKNYLNWEEYMYAYYDPVLLTDNERYKKQFENSMKFNPEFPQKFDEVDETGFVCPEYSEIIEDSYRE